MPASPRCKPAASGGPGGAALPARRSPPYAGNPGAAGRVFLQGRSKAEASPGGRRLANRACCWGNILGTSCISRQKIPLSSIPATFPSRSWASTPEFAQTLTEVVLQFDPEFDAATVEMRPSKGGNYMGLTFTVRATREQLDALYRALHGHPMVSIVL